MKKDDKQLSYWNKQLNCLKNSEKYIWDYCNESSYKRSIYKEVFDKKHGDKLSKICKKNSLLIYTFLISTLKVTLSKYMNKNDIAISIPYYSNDNNRENIHVNKLLPLISYIDCEKTYLEYMYSIKAKLLEAYKNQHYLNAKILLQNGLPNDVMKLTQINVCMKGLHQDKDINYICDSSKNELSFLFELIEDKSIGIHIIYNSNKITEVTVKALYESYTTALEDILDNYNKKIKDIRILSKRNLNKILYEFNDTKVDYPKDKTIQELFEIQVEKTPNNIAVVFEDKKLTYRELNERANSLARVLRDKGVKADSIVGIMVEKSLEMIVGIMGILKAGGAYLPIDPKYPKERIEYMLNNSKSKILLSENNLAEYIEFNGERIDLFNEELFINESNNLNGVNKSSDLAYIIYTSGTTGAPKGVMIEHKSLNNYIEYSRSNYLIEKELYMPLYTSVSFDLTITSIFAPLMSGNTIIIYNEIEIGKLINEVFSVEKQAVIKLTPAHLSLLKQMKIVNKSIKKIIVGGENLTEKICNQISTLFEDKIEIINEYGPTEATVGCIVHKYNCKNNYRNSIFIGKPINNTKIYILKNNEIMPIGVAGELHISGDGVARGYLNSSELTAEKFVDNPFEAGTKMYKTGDLARWLPDGNIEFLGRIDSQVKIRGFRIELGEIENKLLQHKSIKEAVVLVKENKDGEIYICAYAVSEKNIEELNLKSYLKETLPEYMIPSYFIQIEKMPLTVNGKLNRREFPEPNLNTILTKYEAPRNRLEKSLAKIWSEVLGINNIGINDNFFDLGGHSLKATILMSKIHKELNKEIPLKELFKLPTIKELSKCIESTEENLYSRIDKMEEKEFYQTSSAQKRMYILQQFTEKSTAYNMPYVFELDGKVNSGKIEEVFQWLTIRHDVLRTYFETLEDEIVQKIDNSYKFKLLYRKVNEDIETFIKEFIRPFDLSKAPLFRVNLIESKGKSYLLMDMHHIISDGTSMNILMEEFSNLYNGVDLEPLKFQYKDFAEWQKKILNSREIKKQEEYWINKFCDEIPVLNIPADYKRPSVQSFEGSNICFEIDEKITQGLKKISKQTGTTMFMLLLSALNIMLSKYSGQEDIVIGAPIDGRPHADLQNIMGMFVNTLPMRNFPVGSKVFEEFLIDVKENCLDAYENQDYQFEELVEKLDLQRDTSRNPLFDVMLILHNMKYYNAKLKDCNIKQYSYNGKTSKFDLLFSAVEREEKIYFDLQYCSSIFKKDTIEKMIKRFKNILSIIINNRKIKISEINVLFNEERKQLLYDFNDTKRSYSKDKTIHGLFEEQAKKTPNNIALVFGDKEIKYKELDKRSSELAFYLSNYCNIKNNNRVGVFLERSEHMIVSILGILKSASAYVPIDPKYPIKKIKEIFDDCEISTVITSRKQISIMNKLQWECKTIKDYICIDSNDIYALEEVNDDTLMNEDLWNYVAESTSNIIGEGGWKSSYTGEEFSKEEMREYSENTLNNLSQYLKTSSNILEIGCASGLTMFKIAPYVNEYYGIDMSNVIIEKNRKRVEEKGIKNITLECLQAHRINKIKDKKFDIIIINSVIQYFPGYNYLRSVIKDSIELINDKGIIYIGDIMDSELKDELIDSLINFKKENKKYVNKTKTEFDSELFVPKIYFEDLAVDFKEIANVNFSKKLHSIENELTKFRYDCIIEIEKSQKNGIVEKNKNQYGLKELMSYRGKKVLNNSNPSDIAYIIYTSGSTGRPKGVMIEHKSVVNLIMSLTDSINFNNRNAILALTNISFDIFVLETLLPLSIGLKIILANEEEQRNPEEINRLILKNNIDILQVTPSRMQILLNVDQNNNSFRNLKEVLIGGEKLKETLLEDLVKVTNANIYNMYGPTETTVWSTFSKVNDAKKTTIGKPISNTQIYILDQYNNTLLIGACGELCISGDGLARGYLNNSKLTAKKFIDNPFIKGEKIYKTGDLARWLPDGNIEFLGRMDHQVKIRGFRIELGEIENQILKNDDIEETIIIDRNDNKGSKYLCAYIVSKKKISGLEMKNYLSKNLPEYMIPSYFIQLDKIPLTYNGKIDRKILCKNDDFDVKPKGTNVEPRNAIEYELAQIWSEILGITNIGIDDNFFELGGHSLEAVILISKISNQMNYQLTTADIYTNQSIRELSKKIINESNINIIISKIESEVNCKFSKCKLEIYNVISNKYIVLFCDTKHQEIIEFIINNYSDLYTPHYIRPFEDYIDNINEYSFRDKFLMDIGIIKESLTESSIKRSIENSLKDQIYNSTSRLSSYVVNNEVIDKYKAFYFQDIFIKCKSASIITQDIEIKNEENPLNILEALKETINKNELLRSSILKENNSNYFIEFDYLKNLSINIIDISIYNDSIVSNILKEVMAKISFDLQQSDFDYKDILYRVVILKENRKDYRMIFLLSHNIFDGNSRNILMKSFFNNYSLIKKEDGDKKEENRSLAYKNYIKSIEKANNDFNIKTYINSNEFIMLKNSLKDFQVKFKKDFPQFEKQIIFSDPILLEYKININENYRLERKELFEAIALYLANNILKTVFSTEKNLMLIIYNLRKFGDQDYSQVIGDFHTEIPILFDTRNNSINYYIEKLNNDYNELFINKQIHLHHVGFGDRRNTREGRMVFDIYESLRFHFNFTGEKQIDDGKEIVDTIKLNKENLMKSGFFYGYRMYSYVFDGHIKLVLPSGVPEELIPSLRAIKI